MSDPTKYDVFLSFRGEDTRDNFTSHLYAELRRKKIETFIDNRLGRGEEISPALYRAIEESKIYVIILSEHYASSSWCLDELTEILKCKERYGREVIPVFYKVDPSNVRHQRQSYAEDFVRHQQRSKDKVDAWKAALFQVAGLSGWDSQVTRPESKLVIETVNDILKKLNRCVLSNSQGMIGIDEHIEQIQTLLHLKSSSITGIWGMGGIGKSTIASALYSKLITDFNSGSIILNVYQEIEKIGLHGVRRKYLSQLLEEEITSSEYNFTFDPRLQQIKVLLVFDDVKDSDQLNNLIGTPSNFGNGSRIIVTSRDKQVLKNANVDESNIYEVTMMDSQDSLQLFFSFAFKQNNPEEPYVSLSKKVLNYAKGLPLALKVLGKFLQGRQKEEWESQLQKLEKLPHPDIFNLLKLSYNGLDDDQKDIFLDIACFYRGEYVKVVEHTLDCCGFFTRIGMKVLEDRCLISISDGKVWLHDLIQEMGHEIVRLENIDPGKRSRLWKPDDIYKVFKKDKEKGTHEIQCIFLDMLKIKKVQLHAKTFKEMCNLRIIKFNSEIADKRQKCVNQNVTFHTFLESLPHTLNVLQWMAFPQRSLPQDFCPENLVTLHMCYSNLKQLWEEEDQDLPNLKRLNLSNSRELTRLPDLSLCPNIEEVILSGCESLMEVYSSSFLDNLNWLCLDGCTKLERLDIRSNILWRSSGLVALRDCHNLQTLLINSRTDAVQSYGSPPFIPEEMIFQNDGEGGYKIRKFHEYRFTITSINELCWLDVSNCMSLTCLPAELLNLKFLRRLCLDGCLKLEELPEIEGTMVGLEELSLKKCKRLKTIPSSIGNLSKLLKLNLAYCESLETFPSSIFKLKLTELNFKGCSMLRTFTEIMEPAESFAHINLTETAIKYLPSSLEYLVGLQRLNLKLCSNLVSLPNNIVKLSLLSHLDCSGCCRLTEIPNNIGSLSSLTELSLKGSSIVNLPESMAYLSRLKSLDLTDCKRLDCVPNNIGRFTSLTKLSLKGNIIVNLPESMAHLSSLKSLNLSDCKLLESVLKLPPNLNQVSAFDCPSIKRMELNSRSNSRGGAFIFHLTNSQELDVASWSNIEEEACIKIPDDAYRSVFFCFPGSTVPRWFHYCCKGHSVTIGKVSPNLLIGFALCVVLGPEKDMHAMRIGNPRFMYKVGFISDGEIYSYDHHYMPEGTSNWSSQDRFLNQDHTLIWKHQLDLKTIGNKLFHAHNFTFEILDDDDDDDAEPCFLTRIQSSTVKEFGICPLYTGKNDGNRLTKRKRIDDNSIEEPSGSKAAE